MAPVADLRSVTAGAFPFDQHHGRNTRDLGCGVRMTWDKDDLMSRGINAIRV